MNKVSIIVPVYKSEKYINKCLSSILSQSYSNLEIIVVDDGSPDGSIELAEEMLESGTIPYSIISQNNRGAAAARNAGIAEATGEWIIAVDSDDIAHRNMIAEMVQCTDKHPEAECVFCDFQVVREDEETYTSPVKPICKVYKATEAVELFYARKVKFISPALLVNKSFIEKNKICYDEGCLFAEDDLYVWKVLACSDYAAHVISPLYSYVRHEGSTMTTSGTEKFLTSYAAAKFVKEKYINPSFSAALYEGSFLARHVFGLLHAASKVMDYKSFSDLAAGMDALELFNSAGAPKGIAVPVLMKLFLVNKRLCYGIMKAF